MLWLLSHATWQGRATHLEVPGEALGCSQKLSYRPHVHTASRAAADARGRAGHQSAAASSLSGLSLQEAQQILNVSKLSPEEIQKVRPMPTPGGW